MSAGDGDGFIFIKLNVIFRSCRWYFDNPQTEGEGEGDKVVSIFTQS